MLSSLILSVALMGQCASGQCAPRASAQVYVPVYPVQQVVIQFYETRAYLPRVPRRLFYPRFRVLLP